MGSPTNIGIEIINGTDVNVTVSFGDSSPNLSITQIVDVKDLFVISAWHNYTTSGEFNVTVTAWNRLGSITKSMLAVVQEPVNNLTIKVR